MRRKLSATIRGVIFMASDLVPSAFRTSSIFVNDDQELRDEPFLNGAFPFASKCLAL